eukprot:1136362-Pelagomonas_calceolata.AAC.1
MSSPSCTPYCSFSCCAARAASPTTSVSEFKHSAPATAGCAVWAGAPAPCKAPLHAPPLPAGAAALGGPCLSAALPLRGGPMPALETHDQTWCWLLSIDVGNARSDVVLVDER